MIGIIKHNVSTLKAKDSEVKIIKEINNSYEVILTKIADKRSKLKVGTKLLLNKENIELKGE